MKIQPIDFHSLPADPPASARFEPVIKLAAKSRFKRLFERQFTSAIRISAAPEKSAGDEFEPSSACLVKMVQSFIEGGNEKQLSVPSGTAAKCGRGRCSCFNGGSDNASVDDIELSGAFCDTEACEILKSLVLCESVSERNLLADTARVVERNNKLCKRKDEICRKIVAHGLSALGYDASVCKSRWERSPSCPAGEYEYIEAIIDGERYVIDVDFRSEFEIARPTQAYKAIIQALPHIYVGKSDRLQRIVSVVSDAAKQSLRKKGMSVPPWRKREYVLSKWVAPHARVDDITRRPETASLGGDSASRVEEWVSLPMPLVALGAKKKITAGLASVMMDD